MSIRDRAFGATCTACQTGTVWASPDGNPIRLCGEHAAELPAAAPGWRRLHDDYAVHRCARCGHHSDWHRLDDALNVSPLDPGARFRCLGGSDLGGCSQLCPDFVRPRRAAAAAVPPGPVEEPGGAT